MPTAVFRCYAELNEFLAPRLRQRAFEQAFATTASVKHTVEALGIPHTEVGLLLVNGAPAGFERRLDTGDRVAVYPAFRSFDLASHAPQPPHAAPSQPPRFICDAHLGALARLLRMSGFDTRYDNHAADAAIERGAAAEQRIVLTRDRELLKRRGVAHGVFVHALEPGQQWREVAARLGLARFVQPLSRCLECNVPLRRIDDAAELAADARLPAAVRERHRHFSRCDVCTRVFWDGSHSQRMQQRIDALLRPPASDGSNGSAA